MATTGNIRTAEIAIATLVFATIVGIFATRAGPSLVVNTPAIAQQNPQPPHAHTDVLRMNGTCVAPSHLAEGVTGSDLRLQHASFLCDASALTSFPDAPDLVMIDFVRDHDIRVSFSGLMEASGRVMRVDHVQQPGKALQATTDDKGRCWIETQKSRVIRTTCVAKVEENGRSTAFLILFERGRT